MTIFVDNDIVWLQISKDNVLLVQSLYAQKNLRGVEPCLVLRETSLDLQILAQVTPWTVVRDQEQMVFGLECVSELNYERVLAHAAHNVTLRYRILLQVLLLYLLLW